MLNKKKSDYSMMIIILLCIAMCGSLFFPVISHAESTYKPVITVGGSSVPTESANGTEVAITLTLSGNSNEKYAKVNLMIVWDSRLSIKKSGGNIVFEKGEAFSDMNVSVTADGSNGFVLNASPKSASSGNCGHNGNMITFYLTLPGNCNEGDYYPIEISKYNSSHKVFIDADGSYTDMQDYLFTSGINNGGVSVKTPPANPTSGTTGDCSWNYNETTKTLTISGNGAMEDYEIANGAPWYYLYQDVNNIVIGNGVTHVGDYAFGSMYKVSDITLPNSVESIGKYSFIWCYALKNLKLGTGLKTIGTGAFVCGNPNVSPANQPMKEIEIPANVTSIGNRAIGYMYNSNTSSYVKNDELTIKGECGSVAWSYAINVNNTFYFNSTKHFFTERTEESKPTCESVGITRIYCTCGDSQTEIADVLGHDWGETVYAWKDDYSQVTAVRTCKRDDTHVETETVSASLTETVSPTTKNDGKKVYTSGVFANAAFEVQTKEIPIPMIKSKETPAPSLTPAPSPSPAADTSDSVITDKYGSKYEIRIDAKGNPYAVLVSNQSGSSKSITVPSTIKAGISNIPVTEIAAKALKNNKNLVKIIIGAGIRKIGARAFYGCKKLKTIIIKTKKLNNKTVGKKAFSHIHKKAVAKVPKKKLKSYRKILRKKGMKGKKQKIKK